MFGCITPHIPRQRRREFQPQNAECHSLRRDGGRATSMEWSSGNAPHAKGGWLVKGSMRGEARGTESPVSVGSATRPGISKLETPTGRVTQTGSTWPSLGVATQRGSGSGNEPPRWRESGQSEVRRAINSTSPFAVERFCVPVVAPNAARRVVSTDTIQTTRGPCLWNGSALHATEDATGQLRVWALSFKVIR